MLLFLRALGPRYFAAIYFLALSIFAVEETSTNVVHLREPRNPPPEHENKRPRYFTLGLGMRFVLHDAQSLAEAKQFATDNMLRPTEPIYKGSGAALFETDQIFHLEPALRAEWELPLSWKNWLSLLSSFEVAYALPRKIVTATGEFRYQNPDAPHVALTDLTYTGSLSVTEQRFSIMPMLGLEIDYTNATLTRWRAMHLLARFSLGPMLATGQRSYSLALAPQYVAVVNDTYSIKSELVQSYSMALLPAARLELGTRMQLKESLHAVLLWGATAVYGSLSWESQGYFGERSGDGKTTYQKIVSGIAEQAYWGIAPAIFLALSMEL